MKLYLVERDLPQHVTRHNLVPGYVLENPDRSLCTVENILCELIRGARDSRWFTGSIWEVEAEGADAKKARVVRQLLWNDATGRRFACDCAKHVLRHIGHIGLDYVPWALEVARAHHKAATSEELEDLHAACNVVTRKYIAARYSAIQADTTYHPLLSSDWGDSELTPEECKASEYLKGVGAVIEKARLSTFAARAAACAAKAAYAAVYDPDNDDPHCGPGWVVELDPAGYLTKGMWAAGVAADAAQEADRHALGTPFEDTPEIEWQAKRLERYFKVEKLEDLEKIEPVGGDENEEGPLKPAGWITVTGVAE